ncbi:Hypothetical predicted protein [Mytilus galloprovincialis]|uniref:Uncharacterized protein n=1 Tax=Mytilus galloprovincialis TaxID=29158 RepID=A0A8B6CM63_MYTGA|nr:Hypothetical predicted protein [Mytilus galloprovincialis]
MTEVTTMRTQSAGRVYPLKEIKDQYPYLRKTQNDPRLTSSASVALRGENSPRRFTDMKDNFQQAALINIVASVNNENKQRHPSSADTVRNTVNVISNLFLQRDRQISIPKPQAFVEVPQKFSKKKPLFNKKSGHQASEKEIENRKRNITLSRSRPLSRDLESAPKQEIKIAVSLQKNMDDTNSLDGSRDWISSPAKVRLARSNSPRHRYATLKKKPEQRATTSISTCEAIDILDATESINQPKPSSVSSIREYATSPNQDSNMYRAKSLPALFPVKRRKSSDAQISLTFEKKQNIHPFKKTSVKAYGGMPNLLVGKNIQGKSNEFEENMEENPRSAPKPSSNTTIPHDHLKTHHKEDKILKEKPIIISQENITLTGRSIPNPRPSSFQVSKSLKHPETDLLYSTLDHIYEKKIVMKQLDKQFEDLRKHISAKMSNLSDGGSMVSESTSDITTYNVVGKAFKSNLSTASISSRNGKQKLQKRVTFAEEPEENVILPEKPILSYDNDRALLNARLMQTKYQFKDRDGNQMKQSKPMNEAELVRLKHKLMPGIHSDDKSKNDFLSDVRISGMSKDQMRSSSRASDTNRSIVSEADTIAVEEAAREWNGIDIDATNRDRTEFPVSQGASSFYPSAHDDDVESYDSEDEFEQMDSYRVVKAIDLGKLSNFQHRKFKNVTHKHDPSTTHFVKIKVK